MSGRRALAHRALTIGMHRWLGRLIVAAGLYLAMTLGAASGTVERAEATALDCPRVVVFGVRGSGENPGFGRPVGEVVRNVLPNRGDPSTRRLALDYRAVDVGFQTGAGAKVRVPGRYHHSVVDGKRTLNALIDAFIGACDPNLTQIVLVGYSQGAHVAGDVFQDRWKADRAETNRWIRGLVLFGDPYFNPASPGNYRRSGYSRSRYGVLGKRPPFHPSLRSRIRSYCHANDLICQGPPWKAEAHSSYKARGEAEDAGRWLSTLLRRHAVARPMPGPGVIVRDPTTRAAWLVNESGRRNWIPTGGDYLCLRARGHRVVNLLGRTLDAIPDEIGVHTKCAGTSVPPPATPRPVTPPAPTSPGGQPSRQPTPPSGPTPVVTPKPAPPPTFAQTTGGPTNTWTNHRNAGGTQGPTIASGATVRVSCRLEGFRVADGNTWWYRIASSPWSNKYYASADAFYNNGQTSGSLRGTPFVDTKVPGC